MAAVGTAYKSMPPAGGSNCWRSFVHRSDQIHLVSRFVLLTLFLHNIILLFLFILVLYYIIFTITTNYYSLKYSWKSGSTIKTCWEELDVYVQDCTICVVVFDSIVLWIILVQRAIGMFFFWDMTILYFFIYFCG